MKKFEIAKQEVVKKEENWQSGVERMNEALKRENVDCAVMEIFSPTEGERCC